MESLYCPWWLWKEEGEGRQTKEVEKEEEEGIQVELQRGERRKGGLFGQEGEDKEREEARIIRIERHVTHNSGGFTSSNTKRHIFKKEENPTYSYSARIECTRTLYLMYRYSSDTVQTLQGIGHWLIRMGISLNCAFIHAIKEDTLVNGRYIGYEAFMILCLNILNFITGLFFITFIRKIVEKKLGFF